MRVWVICLCFASVQALRGLDLSNKGRNVVEVDWKAKYEELYKKHQQLLIECNKIPPPPTPPQPVSVQPRRDQPVTVDPQPVARDERTPSPISGEIGAPDEMDSKPVYKPPMSESGKPSNSQGYDYKKQGADWPDNFAQCGASNQSPVDLPATVDIPGQTKAVLWFDYYADRNIKGDENEMTLTNAGHSVFAHLDRNKLRYGGVKLVHDRYKAYDLEFHAPSEHTFAGQEYPLEAQIFHRDPKGKMLVVSLLFEKGEKSNKYLKAMLDATGKKLPEWSQEAAAGHADVKGEFLDMFNLENLLPKRNITSGRDLAFFNYEGSLTQPPCTGGVEWWVLANPMSATEDEILGIWQAIFGSSSMKKTGNHRAVQPMGNRQVRVGHVGFASAGMGHRQPGMRRWPKKARGYNSHDHPFLPAEKAHWKESATPNKDDGYGEAWVRDPDDKLEDSKVVKPANIR